MNKITKLVSWIIGNYYNLTGVSFGDIPMPHSFIGYSNASGLDAPHTLLLGDDLSCGSSRCVPPVYCHLYGTWCGILTNRKPNRDAAFTSEIRLPHIIIILIATREIYRKYCNCQVYDFENKRIRREIQINYLCYIHVSTLSIYPFLLMRQKFIVLCTFHCIYEWVICIGVVST